MLAAAAAALALAVGAARPARALEDAAPGSGGALRISADPPVLVLGRDALTELRITAPAEVEEVALSASAGRFEGLHRIPGGFAARYRPPTDRVPQVAIVSALARTARGPVDGWLAVPLFGQGDARVRARPGAEVALRIGDRTFGPTRAGRDGVAVIPVVVPPGVREAHHGFVPIDLHVPETALLHAVADRAEVLADRAEQIHVVAYVVAPHGAARRGDVPAFEPSRGSVTMAPRESGAYEGTWTLPPGAAGEERLSVRLPGASASRAVLRIGTAAGPPATVAVAFDRSTLEAGVAEVAVTARVLDAAGNPTAAALEVESDVGTLSAPSPGVAGTVTATLAVPSGFGGRDRLTVTARAPEVGIAGARALLLVPGPPAVARFAPAGEVIVADGAREATLRLAVEDRFGNPVAGAPALEAEQGRVVGVDETGPGAWRVRYLAPAVPARTGAGIVAAVGPARARADLLLVPPRAQLAVLVTGGVAADARGRFAAPRAGVAAERAAALPLELSGGISAAWRLEGEYLGWRRSSHAAQLNKNRSVFTPGEASRAGVFLAGLSAALPLRRGPELWGTATVGMALATARPSGGSSGSGMAPAARLGVAAGWPLRHGTPFLEASVLAAGRTPAGAFAAFGLAAGVRFEMEMRHGDDPDRR